MDALYARRTPQGNYTIKWEFPPLPSVLSDFFLHHALFPDFFSEDGRENIFLSFLQSGNAFCPLF